MQTFFDFTLILLLLFSPLVFLRTGEIATELLARRFNKNPSQNGHSQSGRGASAAFCFVFGLLIFIWQFFILRLCFVPAELATFIPYLCLLHQPERALKIITSFRPRLNFNFVLWFLVMLVTGLTLFQGYGHVIQTPWKNNYGDLTVHLGMINAFTRGDNFPPQYHLLAGTPLSYPFFINLWSSIFWWSSQSYTVLAFIFLFQWLCLWTTIYFLLNGNRYLLLPWALFFGGGCYLYIGQNSGELIPKNVPWTVFLTTIWVPQRSAFFGVTVLLAALQQFLKKDRSNFDLLLCGALLSLSPLAHAHLFMVTVAFIGTVLLFEFFDKFSFTKLNCLPLLYFGLALLPTVFSLPWLLGKSGMIEPMSGWYSGDRAAENIVSSGVMWFKNAPFWFLLIGLFWAQSRRHNLVLACLVLFAIGNFVKLSNWEWDQIKFFIGIYAIFLACWASRSEKRLYYSHFACLSLMVPAIIEVFSLIGPGENFTVYVKEDLKLAEELIKLSDVSAIIAGDPAHNSPLTLTGRRMFMGYEGTLSSHDLKYESQRLLMQDFNLLADCRKEAAKVALDSSLCPDYLIWTDREKQRWNKDSPGEKFTGTGHPQIFKFN